MIDAYGCHAGALRDKAHLAALLDSAVRELALKVLGTPQWHQFGGAAGITALYLLSESHLTVHTFPETGLATFNLYCCRPRPVWNWEEQLKQHLGADRVVVRDTARGE